MKSLPSDVHELLHPHDPHRLSTQDTKNFGIHHVGSSAADHLHGDHHHPNHLGQSGVDPRQVQVKFGNHSDDVNMADETLHPEIGPDGKLVAVHAHGEKITFKQVDDKDETELWHRKHSFVDALERAAMPPEHAHTRVVKLLAELDSVPEIEEQPIMESKSVTSVQLLVYPEFSRKVSVERSCLSHQQ